MIIQSWFSQYHEKCHVYKSTVMTSDEAKEIVDSFVAAVKSHHVILYGAGTVGCNSIRLFEALSINIDSVYDRSVSGSKLGNYPVRSADLIGEAAQSEDNIVIVSVNEAHYPEIYDFLREKGFTDSQILNGHEVHMVLQSAYCMLLAEKTNSIINTLNCWECTILNNQCESLRRYLMRLKGKQEEELSGCDKIRMIGYVLGNICSLNCKNCCECIPYYKSESRAFVPAEQVVRDIIHLSSACSFIPILEFIGGEPFLHPALTEIMRQCSEISNVGSLHVFTNGTVVPKDDLCKTLVELNVEVYISNYRAALEGRLRENRNRTIEKLKEFGVPFVEGAKQDWKDFRSFKEMPYTEEEASRNFSDCFIHNCNRLYRGILYTCAHQYAGEQLGILPAKDGVLRIHEYTPQQLAKELNHFRELPTIDACMHCKMPYRAEPALSGEQI